MTVMSAYLHMFSIVLINFISNFVRCFSFNNELNLNTISKCNQTNLSATYCYVEANCTNRGTYENYNYTCLLQQISQQNDVSIYQNQSELPNLYVWIYSLGSAFFISLAGVWGYLLLPLLTGAYRDHVMNVLVGLSFGSLITSSLCQLIPEAYELSLVSPKYLQVAVFSMIGVWITSLTQSLATILGKEDDKPKEHVPNRRDSLIAVSNLEKNTGNGYPLYQFPPPNTDNDDKSAPVITEMTKLNADSEIPKSKLLLHRASGTSAKKEAKLSKLAIVILAGDCMNNFMDGISIGAGYSYQLSTGIKLSTAIAFEEYTHKLGDFAIVFQSGISMKRVLFWNYTTSCACFLGVVIGIALGNLDFSQYIFSFASGLFLYIALSNMIPELQNMLATSLNKSKKLALISLLEQHVGFIFAFVLLIIISDMLNQNSVPISHT